MTKRIRMYLYLDLVSSGTWVSSCLQTSVHGIISHTSATRPTLSWTFTFRAARNFHSPLRWGHPIWITSSPSPGEHIYNVEFLSTGAYVGTPGNSDHAHKVSLDWSLAINILRFLVLNCIFYWSFNFWWPGEILGDILLLHKLLTGVIDCPKLPGLVYFQVSSMRTHSSDIFGRRAL